MNYIINDTKVHFIILNTKFLEFIFRVVILLETSQNMRYFSGLFGDSTLFYYFFVAEYAAFNAVILIR